MGKPKRDGTVGTVRERPARRPLPWALFSLRLHEEVISERVPQSRGNGRALACWLGDASNTHTHTHTHTLGELTGVTAEGGRGAALGTNQGIISVAEVLQCVGHQVGSRMQST